MQTIHDNVTVLVTERALQARATRRDGSNAATAALQYVVENAGFDVVTFRVDFSESANIKLHRPGHGPKTLQKATQELVFECELRPFERCELAYVVKKGIKRAFVHVQYQVTAVVTPSVDVIVSTQERTAMILQQQLRRSNTLFRNVSKWKTISCRPQSEAERACTEVNRFFRDFGDVFVDASFPPNAQSLYDSEAPHKLSEADSAVYTLCSWEHLHRVINSSWALMAPSRLSSRSSAQQPKTVVSFTSGLPSQDSFLSALSILAPYCDLWFYKWFPSLHCVSEIEDMAAISVALCHEGLTWQHVIIDLFFPSFPLGKGLMTPRNVHGELYATLLHKAYAKLKGSYAAVSHIPTIAILQELTGSLWVCLYRGSGDTNEAQPNEQLQNTVESILLPRHQGRGLHLQEPDALVIATFREIDNHRRAFRLTISSDEDGNTSSIVLHDDSASYLLKKLAATLADVDQNQDPAELRVSWGQLMALEPTLWSFSHRLRYEQRSRQVQLHQSGTVTMTTAISLPALSTISFSCLHLKPFASKSSDFERQQGQQDQTSLSLSIVLVESDFSLTPIKENSSEVLSKTSFTGERPINSLKSVCSQQVVKTLSAGEYVVTISATRPALTESHPLLAEEKGKCASDKVMLTPATVDENVQLAFDCLDREGKHELSENDIASFLQLHECVLPSQDEKEAIRSFMDQHSSSTNPESDEKKLTLDDFREIYLALAMQDCSEVRSNNSNAASSCAIRARFQEIVWHDLLRLLPSGDDSNNRCTIDRRDIVEMVSCFHSDVPLLNVITLANNNFNM